MYKTISAIAAAASIAAAITILLPGFMMLPGFTPDVAASTSLPTVNTAAKADRLDVKSFGPSCAQQSWPYYEAGCLRYFGSPTREARAVRVIAVR